MESTDNTESQVARGTPQTMDFACQTTFGSAAELIGVYQHACTENRVRPLPRLMTHLQNASVAGEPLSVLDLRDNTLNKRQCISIAALIPQKVNPYLHTVDMGVANVRDEGAEPIIQSLALTSTVEKLDLRFNQLTGRTVSSVAELVAAGHSLRVLDLTGNGIDVRGHTALATALRSPNCRLQVLRLSDTDLEVRSLQELTTALAANTSVLNLHLAENMITAQGATMLAQLLKTNTTIVSLDIRFNSIMDDGASMLASALTDNKTLLSLVLWSNHITEVGAQALSTMLKTNTTLQNLDLGRNSIGAGGCQALCNALSSNASLSTLGLASASIQPEDAIQIAAMVGENKALVRLDLRRNILGMSCILALSRAMNYNKTLQCVCLDVDELVQSETPDLASMITTELDKIQQLCEQNIQRAQTPQFAAQSLRQLHSMQAQQLARIRQQSDQPAAGGTDPSSEPTPSREEPEA